MTRDTDDLPRLYDDPRDKYDDAEPIVNAAMSNATGDVEPDDADALVARAQLQTRGTIDEDTHELALGATQTAIQRERGH